jgi:hypothetical protein
MISTALPRSAKLNLKFVCSRESRILLINELGELFVFSEISLPPRQSLFPKNCLRVTGCFLMVYCERHITLRNVLRIGLTMMDFLELGSRDATARGGQRM